MGLLDSLLQEKKFLTKGSSMDLQALLVFVGGFAVCCGFVFLVSIFGAKEQTFEEALAAQKKKNEKEKKTKGGKKDKKDQGDKKSKPWKKKGKGDREEKVVLLDDEEEQVVVVPSPVIEEPLPVEEPTPEATPLPTPESTPKPVKTKKERKKEEKRKRMEIEEVQEIIEESVEVELVEVEPVAEEPVAEEPVVIEEAAAVLEEKVEVIEPVVEEEIIEEVAATPVVESKPSPVKQPKSKKNKGDPKDLLAVIKKTAFSDSEAQQLIDVLLTKQSGENLNNSEEWIEKGKPTESQKLRQQLNELEKLLGEEQMKGKSFQDKMAALRVELNQEKSAKAAHTRIVEEMNARHGQEVNMVNNKVQGFMSENNLLKGQLSQVQLQMRDTEAMRAQYQATIDNLSGQLQMATNVAATASANDPHILSELEQLRTLRDKYEVTLAELSTNNTTLTSQLSSKMEEVTEIKSQVSLQNEELMGLRNQVNAEQSKVNVVQTALNTKTDEGKTLTAELARVTNLNESLKQIQEAETQKTTVDPAVEAELASVKVKLSEKETENSRLREDNERLGDQLASSVERPAAEGEEAGAENHNGVAAQDDSEETAKAAANEKLAEEWREKFDSLTAEHSKMLAKQKVVEADFDAQLGSRKSDLDNLKSKNNELSESLVKSKALLLRLFPSLSSEMELSVMETEAQQYIQGLAKRLASCNIKVLSRNTENQGIASTPVEDKSEELEKLEGQVAHYKSVLNQTETMLNALQASVEAAEGEWRSKLEVAQRELTSLKSENSNLLSRVDSAKDTEEMQGKLVELEAKLGAESVEKGELEKKNTNLVELLEKEKGEKNELSKSVEALETRESELSSTNTKLQQVLATTKEALSKETDINNKSLQLDQTSSKDDVSSSDQNVQSVANPV